MAESQESRGVHSRHWIRAANREVQDKYNERLDRGGQVCKTELSGSHAVILGVNSDSKLDAIVVATDSDEDREFGKSRVIRSVDEVWMGCGLLEDLESGSSVKSRATTTKTTTKRSKSRGSSSSRKSRSREKHGEVSRKKAGNVMVLVRNRGRIQSCTVVSGSLLEFELLHEGEVVTRVISVVGKGKGSTLEPRGWIETNRGIYAVHSFNCLPSNQDVAFVSWDSLQASDSSRPIEPIVPAVPMRNSMRSQKQIIKETTKRFTKVSRKGLECIKELNLPLTTEVRSRFLSF
jgi:hypothetical protein